MTATLAASVAILKRRYKDGVPKTNFNDFPMMGVIDNPTDFDGEDYAFSIQTENPQGIAPTVADAQDALEQGKYRRFVTTRKEYFGVVRIKGQALKAAKGPGALIDLWKRETDGVTREVIKNLEIFAFGNGTGIFGQIASGQGTTTVTLTRKEDAANFAVGMKVNIVSDATFSPTVRGGASSKIKITAVDRAAGTLTAAAAWSTTAAGTAANDFIVRAGNQAVSGSPTVLTGLKKWVEGGSTPGTWATLPRNEDPVRMAGQVLDATGLTIEELVPDMESLVSAQGQQTKKQLWIHTTDYTSLKKTIQAKATYDRSKVESKYAGISYRSLQFEGDFSTIDIMPSPFVPKGEVFLQDMSTYRLHSLGPAPQLLNFDSNEMLRVTNDDAYEARIGLYGDFECHAPGNSIRAINVGA